jgi:hypothetical protein
MKCSVNLRSHHTCDVLLKFTIIDKDDTKEIKEAEWFFIVRHDRRHSCFMNSGEIDLQRTSFLQIEKLLKSVSDIPIWHIRDLNFEVSLGSPRRRKTIRTMSVASKSLRTAGIVYFHVSTIYRGFHGKIHEILVAVTTLRKKKKNVFFSITLNNRTISAPQSTR